MQADLHNSQLVHHTALAFIVQKDHQQVQALRQRFDPAFMRWPPHINFKFPFVDVPHFEQSYQILQKQLIGIPPFEINFRRMEKISQATVCLVPQTKGNQLQDINNAIAKALPFLKEQRPFHPHMTVGKFTKGDVVQKVNQLQKDWKQWTIYCDGICLIHRGKDTPFQTYKKIQFKG